MSIESIESQNGKSNNFIRLSTANDYLIFSNLNESQADFKESGGGKIKKKIM